MKDAFALGSIPKDDGHGSKGWLALRYAYMLLMMVCFCLEISCIFIATNAGIQVRGPREGMRAPM